jgi:sigma-B regulation protein RsbQ
MWKYVTPAFENDYQIILFDHVGAGQSDLGAYVPAKYQNLEGYADDILGIIQDLKLKDVIFVGHSVAAMMGILAARKSPELFKNLILVGPSPFYINEGDYIGGFTRTQIDELLESMDDNHLGWSMTMAPVIMANPDRKELSEELANSFCRTDPDIAKQFARTTFLSDTRAILPTINIPSLILQCSDDVIAPRNVGQYVHDNLPASKIVFMKATGHCPNLSAPQETIEAIKTYLSGWIPTQQN